MELNKEEDEKAKVKKGPHLVNLNEDPQLSGVITHGLGSKKTKIGHLKAKPSPNIRLSGLRYVQFNAFVIGGPT